MLQYSPHSIPRRLSISQIQKFIPKRWREGNFDKSPTSYSLKESITKAKKTSDDSMIDFLLTSIRNLVEQGNLSKAFKTFSLIQYHASSTASYNVILHPISSLLLSCTNFKLLPQGKQLHAQIIVLGLERHQVLVPKLVSFYSNFNFLVDAHIVTEDSNLLHPLPWNMLISSYVRYGEFSQALSVYKQMVNKGIRPDNFTYPSVLKACGELMDIGFGMEVHKSIEASSLQWSLFVHNALVSMYGRLGLIDVAHQMFDKMPDRDAVSWNAIISAYASRGMWNEAIQLFKRMQEESMEVNIITWNTIAGGYLRTGNFKGALELLSRMRSRGAQLDSVALIIGLGACSHIGVIKLGKEIHGFAIRNGTYEYDNFKNVLITMYSRCKDLRHAYTLFRLIEEKSTVTWNSMLSSYAHMDLAEEASSLFREMLRSGIKPNYVTIASILPLCARVANLSHGKEFHCYIMKRKGFGDYLLLWNALVDMYARSGKVLEAKRVFDSLTKRDEVTYTSMIAGYGMLGEGQAALKLFEEMNRLQIKPDHVTLVAVLSACSHSGLVTQGQMVFEKMPIVYGISPRLEHYDCMIDLFGRAGLLNKAKEMIKRMPYRPTSAMWATLIGACRIHGNTDIGEWAAENLLEMRPEHSGYYVLIANMYAAAGCWNKVAMVRTFMRDLGVRKAPGCAWVDAGNGLSPFLVGDTSHTYRDDVYPLLDGLTELMKDDGYVPIESLGSVDHILEA
ncbi:pentatricopeptide repeat-containing protein At1g71490 isoform X1 [Ziziphus jujuba]|uniref:Pentatricopeptide repeat-containing protein At1g71490 isoform X1 n=1 Tax=Ziziphus jujuba TaxID=326968 RepID=A0A6P3ZZ52_ZIZJJ|nr:pentatricopeptide repeat-containing protein At1g71490 isoform X1 [Ziziphus jujuba]XP_060673465.1 pentatricopeptide repeat-containing protein At1g71490 isoform X1 [Ziziphus jujuba]